MEPLPPSRMDRSLPLTWPLPTGAGLLGCLQAEAGGLEASPSRGRGGDRRNGQQARIGTDELKRVLRSIWADDARGQSRKRRRNAERPPAGRNAPASLCSTDKFAVDSSTLGQSRGRGVACVTPHCPWREFKIQNGGHTAILTPWIRSAIPPPPCRQACPPKLGSGPLLHPHPLKKTYTVAKGGGRRGAAAQTRPALSLPSV